MCFRGTCQSREKIMESIEFFIYAKGHKNAACKQVTHNCWQEDIPRVLSGALKAPLPVQLFWRLVTQAQTSNFLFPTEQWALGSDGYIVEDILSHSDLLYIFISEHTSCGPGLIAPPWTLLVYNNYLEEWIWYPTNEQRVCLSICLCIDCLTIPRKTFTRFIHAQYCCRDAPTSPHLLLTPNIWMSSAPHISIKPKPMANVNLQASAQAFCGHKLTAVFTQDPPNIFFQGFPTCI